MAEPLDRGATMTSLNTSPHHRIRSMEITGGFLSGVTLEFADGLNCIIGGRGTGKTTTLEFVRYALELVPDRRGNPTLARNVEKLVHGNLQSGRVRLRVETMHGMQYLAERSQGEKCQVFDENRKATPVSLNHDSIFKADVYSQNEIEQIAINTKYQLSLLDKFIDEDMREISRSLHSITRTLDQNSGLLRSLNERIDELSDTASQSVAVEQKLKALQVADGAAAGVINAAHTHKALRAREQNAIRQLREDVKHARELVTDSIVSVTSRITARLDNEVTEGPNQEFFATVAETTRAFLLSLDDASSQVRSASLDASTALATAQTQLDVVHAEQEAVYRTIVMKSEEERGRAAERQRLQKRHVEVAAAQQELSVFRKRVQAANEQRQDLISKLSTLQDERFRLRKEVAERLSKQLHPFIRVSVAQAGERDAYSDILIGSLRGTGMKYGSPVAKIVENVPPQELARLVDRDDTELLAERAGITEEKARRIIAALKAGGNEARYALDAIDLEDLPSIRLLDGDEYKDSANLSTGQRCTTILPILLLESERPLLIDQPEDNLDNAFIYRTIVQQVVAAKKTRQLIFVTHNPNIPVLGNAERVFVLTSNGKSGSVEAAGTVDEVKHQIETILEGGREAFVLRKKRYGH